ncbi:MAG: DNA uptake protein [Burkholderiales bacterium RIFCSPLOWO2_02_FULL_57_36]|nr:MAG: DNA uptake protein [Burkholderiales bacterium RIFCSPLOWO2_02_FULL_57_36]
MFKRLISGIAVFVATIGFAFAQVDVNKADQAALDGIKGIGPKTSKAILDERKKGGDFKSWDDFENRVKGIGGKSSAKLSQAGLTVSGQAKPDAPAAASKVAKKDAKLEAKSAKADSKSDAKSDTKAPKKM